MTKRLITALATIVLACTALAVPASAAVAGQETNPEWRWPVALVRPQATEQDWAPLTPRLWNFADGQVVLTEQGSEPEGPRRPYEYAIVQKGPKLGSLSYRAQVRIDEPVTVHERDVVLIFNYQSPTKFYYVHLSQSNDIYAHNGIFVVDGADRERIDDQWNGSIGASPAIEDTEWHDVRLEYRAWSGRIAVYVDGAHKPLMTATDTSFATGRFGFGSFDNYGRTRAVSVLGIRAS